MTEQPQGNFIAGQNRSKEQGTNYPDFTGRLSIPGRDHENAVALWVARDKNGNVYFSGRMDPTPITDNVKTQIESLADRPVEDMTDVAEGAANLNLRPGQLVCFANSFKQPDPRDTTEEAEKRAKRPDYWGRLLPGDGSPVVAISIWLDQDRYKRPILRGATSYPIPGMQPGDEVGPRPGDNELATPKITKPDNSERDRS
ncbi:MAG: hypothetical protein K0U74_12135 [Alphaproteobacteria bacterium]|nr:hypothetical protein [Alphaproteobacteria bacterium]